MAASNVNGSAKPSVGYLGPEGTYTHQAAYERFGDDVHYIPFKTIADTFHSAGNTSQIALIPIENSIHGSVVETLDLLRSPRLGKSVFIQGEVTLKISHALVVRQGTALEDIRVVGSHEQALGQCSSFLQTVLPGASLDKATSTAAAARRVLDHPSNDYAAICSTICLKLYPGLEALRENIQDGTDNFTRFILLSSSEVTSGIASQSEISPTHTAIFRLSIPLQAKPGLTLQTVLLALLPLNVIQIDRRPSLSPRCFHDVYFITTEHSEGNWEDTLHAAEQRAKDILCPQESQDSGSEFTMLGSW